MKTLYTGIKNPDPTYIHTPLIEIHPVRDNKLLKQVADGIALFDYVLFTSRFTVKYFAPLISNKVRCVVSIGNTTTEALKKAGFTDIKQVKEDNSYGVIAWFENQNRGNVLIPRSNLALDIIPDGLRQLGFEVTTVVAYENRMPKDAERIDIDEIDEIIFTSPSTIDNFIKLYGSIPTDKKLMTRGPITDKHLQTIIKTQNL